MKTTYLVAFFLVMTSSAEDGHFRSCADKDLCSAIVFNQIALADIKNGMGEFAQTLTSEFQENTVDVETLTQIITLQFQETSNEIKKLIMSLKPSISGDKIHQGELESCLAENNGLKNQIKSLERKNQEIMSRDEAPDYEKIVLRQENEDLKKIKEDLVDATSRLEELVTLQKKQIINLTLFNYMPVDCADLMVQGQTQSGVYTIYPYRIKEETMEVLCDLESNGGGWTVFFTRQPQYYPIDFNESWENFKKGFGNVRSEYWLGNDVLHLLTSYGTSMFRIDAESYTGDKRWAEWAIFNVGNEDSKYRLTVEQYRENSTMGDSLSRHSNISFTTFDQDNDDYEDLNCAVGSRHYKNWGRGGWWYKSCGSTRPTAPLKNTNDWDSACWDYWNANAEKELISFKTLSMKFRRQNYEELADLHMPF